MKYLLHGEKSERLVFREIRESDYSTWLEFHRHPASTQHWIADFDSPEVECSKWYDNQFKRYAEDRGGMNALIEKNTGKLVGHCGLLVQIVDNITELEIGYSLLPAFWGKGYATEAAIKCKVVAFTNEYAESLISIISLTNIPSENVALKNGMHKDKVTIYKGNQVSIFRICKEDWNQSKVIKL